jgi:hypothetical protein
MTSQAYLVQPPRIAVWLVSLFTRAEEAESILGDLLEEYFHLASKSGVAVARSWYWRQTVKTIAHLVGAGFRVTPWSTTAAVVGGFLLLRFVSGLPERAIFAVLHRYRVFEHHFNAYVFFATDGIAIGHVIASMFVGCMVALAAKGREMIATMTLALVLGAMAGAASLVLVARGHNSFPPWMLPWYFADWFAIVIGGAIIRTRRFAATTLPSGA